MKTNLLLVATALTALTTANAMAAPASPVVHHSEAKRLLYYQNSDASGANINSQNYTSGTYTSDNDQGADDFIVPRGTWKVTAVDVTGCCAYTTSIRENVYFYKDNNGVPGKAVKNGSFTGIYGNGNPNFEMSLGKGVKLKAGHYWVSVVANCNYKRGCGWGWAERSTIVNDAAQWQNPGNGHATGCTAWTTLATCFGSAYAGDFMFELKGKD